MPDDPYPFDGFSKPTYTQVPDELLDVLMPDLSESELKVLLYVVRRTFGFGKDRDAISLNQMIDGIRTRDGRVLDRGTGLSRSSVRRGVQGLTDKGILIVAKVKSDEGDYETNVYGLRFKSGRGVVPISNDPAEGVVPNPNHPGFKSDPRVVPDSPPQETVEQQTEHQDRAVEDSKARRTDLAKYDTDRLDLLPYVEGYAREFRDQAPLASSVTRVVSLYKSAGLDLDTFITRMEQARAITKERTGSIRAGEGGKKQMMPYFLTVLTDLVGQESRKSG